MDGDEISNIKNLLNSEEIIDEDVSLEDVMTTTTPKEYIKLEKKTKKKKKRKKWTLNAISAVPIWL